jgi:hypothetical protein
MYTVLYTRAQYQGFGNTRVTECDKLYFGKATESYARAHTAIYEAGTIKQIRALNINSALYY